MSEEEKKDDELVSKEKWKRSSLKWEYCERWSHDNLNPFKRKPMKKINNNNISKERINKLQNNRPIQNNKRDESKR